MAASPIRRRPATGGRRHGILRRVVNDRQPEGVPVAEESSRKPSRKTPRRAAVKPLDPEAQRVAQTVFSSIWLVTAPSNAPLPAGAPSLDEALNFLAGTQKLSGPPKLELLARVARSGKIDLNAPSLRTLASSLFDTATPDINTNTDDSPSALLLDALANSKEGRDPLGRDSVDKVQHLAPVLSQYLLDDIKMTVLAMDVTCDAHPVIANGLKALSIHTSATTGNALADYLNLVDPLNWPDCAVQHIVFRSMQPVDPVTHVPIDPTNLPSVPWPDTGWAATICETVDLGLETWSGLQFTTFLDFVFVHNVTGAADDTIGCTYDLQPGTATGIVADRGYLLVDNDPADPTNARRVQTLKEVYFASDLMDSFLNPGLICSVWGPACAIINYACLGSPTLPTN
jgi:hypothetical protein